MSLLSGFTSDTAGASFRQSYDQLLDRLWPADRRSIEVPTTFGPTAVHRTGWPDGTALVLLPGAGGNALMWHRHVAGLGRARPVIAIDPVGEPGGSTQTRPVVGGPDLALWLEEVLAAEKVDRAHVVGCSYGGWVGLQHELRHPGRAASITLLDPAGFGRVSARFLAWIIVGGLAALTPKPVRHRAARLLRNATLLDDDLMAMARLMTRFRRRLPNPPPITDDELRAVGIPVLAMFGARSAMYDPPQVAARVVASVPAGHAQVIAGASHDLPLYDPELIVERILAFVESEVEEHR